MPEPSWKQDLLLREMQRCLPSTDPALPAAAPTLEECNCHALMPWSTWEAVQAANLRQAVTTFERVRARLGDRRFRGMLIKLKVHQAMGLEQEITALPAPLERTQA